MQEQIKKLQEIIEILKPYTDYADGMNISQLKINTTLLNFHNICSIAQKTNEVIEVIRQIEINNNAAKVDTYTKPEKQNFSLKNSEGKTIVKIVDDLLMINSSNCEVSSINYIVLNKIQSFYYYQGMKDGIGDIRINNYVYYLETEENVLKLMNELIKILNNK